LSELHPEKNLVLLGKNISTSEVVVKAPPGKVFHCEHLELNLVLQTLDLESDYDYDIDDWDIGNEFVGNFVAHDVMLAFGLSSWDLASNIRRKYDPSSLYNPCPAPQTCHIVDDQLSCLDPLSNENRPSNNDPVTLTPSSSTASTKDSSTAVLISGLVGVLSLLLGFSIVV